jgi:hypothetical protein
MNSILARFIPGLLGDKTSTIIGCLLGYVLAGYTDFSAYVPAKYAPWVSTALGTLTAIFGAYVVRPGSKNAQAVVDAHQS